MKKRYLNMALVLLMSLSLAACGTRNDASEGKTNSADSNAKGSADYNVQLNKDRETYKQYVTLGEYKGIEVSINKADYDVTQDDINNYIENIRKINGESKEVTTGVTKEGDTIRLDYSGTLNGVAFMGGTATDVEYTIGSGRFIEDLEKGLAGLEVGKEYEIPCRFADPYLPNAELSGKDVIFTVKVSAIIDIILPEYNDDFVKTVVATGAYNTTAQTAADFTKFVEEQLNTSSKQQYESKKYSLIWDKIYENSTVSGYPEEELKSVTETIIKNAKTEYTYYKAYYADIDSFESYLKGVYGFSDENAFNDYANKYAEEYLAEKMIITLIGEKENVAVTEDEIKEYGELIAAENNYASYQAIIDELGEEIKLEVGYSVLADKVSDILLSSAVEK